MKPRNYLTKSTFKVGLECPRKLYYLGKEDEYFNNKQEDPFLEALAQGGYQVGMLAQLTYPSGIEIKEHNHELALKATQNLMAQENAIIFEGAFAKDTLFVRADIAIKANNNLRIIEVKSKSFDDSESDVFEKLKSKPGNRALYADWIPYIYDLAYQTYVARQNYPDLKVSASLMLLDKTKSNPTDGLHEYFLIKSNNKNKEVILTKPLPKDFKGHHILKEIDLTELINDIIEGKETSEFIIKDSVPEMAKKLSEIYTKNQIYPANKCISSDCKKCEYRGTHDNLKSGFDECWIEAANIASASSQKFSFDLWYPNTVKHMIGEKRYLLSEIIESDLKEGGKRTQRQLLQIDKHKTDNKDPSFNKEVLKAHMESWTYPLHFIDFETCTPAIPFLKGYSPYSETAFQFSHHTMQEDGSIKHAGEFIDLTPGKFPSFDFIRALKSQLEKDDGTIFCYSNHENSVLNRIVGLLERSNELDKKELIEFIKTITTKKHPEHKNKKDPRYLWQGTRNMVDLLEIVKECYYSPLMGSSNSLKYVLPVILNESKFLQEKYSKPIYGTKEIPSLNFKDKVWIKFDGKNYSADPYQELPPLFSEEDLLKIEGLISEEDQIKNGGAAMMAYCKTQFTQMSDQEREAIRKALLKYCELDTLAMLMLVEYWQHI